MTDDRSQPTAGAKGGWFCWACGTHNPNPLWPWCGKCSTFRYADDADAEETT